MENVCIIKIYHIGKFRSIYILNIIYKFISVLKIININSWKQIISSVHICIILIFSLTGPEYLNTINSYEFNLLISRYKFIIAYENSICDDYITEKFWRAITTGVIPIYFGAPNIEVS